jgi:hypothetical protein
MNPVIEITFVDRWSVLTYQDDHGNYHSPLLNYNQLSECVKSDGAAEIRVTFESGSVAEHKKTMMRLARHADYQVLDFYQPFTTYKYMLKRIAIVAA